MDKKRLQVISVASHTDFIRLGRTASCWSEASHADFGFFKAALRIPDCLKLAVYPYCGHDVASLYYSCTDPREIYASQYQTLKIDGHIDCDGCGKTLCTDHGRLVPPYSEFYHHETTNSDMCTECYEGTILFNTTRVFRAYIQHSGLDGTMPIEVRFDKPEGDGE